MAQRLQTLKMDLNMILPQLKMDSLLTSEWDKLEEIAALLEPFKVRTDTLQSNALSLSYVIPRCWSSSATWNSSQNSSRHLVK